jgi:hypothetical protein
MPYATPDFWPMTMTVRPSPSLRRIGEFPKSKSGHTSSGQLSFSGRQPTRKASLGVTATH